jgi:tetratricopeptide (TPR) repeat protein
VNTPSGTSSPTAREAELRRRVEEHWRARRLPELLAALEALEALAPGRLEYCARRATLLDAIGRTDEAVAAYRRFLERRPDAAAAWYNLGILLRRQRRYREAVAAYEQALSLGIDRPEEVHSNLGVLHAERRDAARARVAYGRALAANASHVPALFNLAGLLEELGDRDQATDLYGRVLAIDPGHGATLARLAHMRRATDLDDPRIDAIRRTIAAPGTAPLTRETLYFALGKLLDDVGCYDDAFAAFTAGNALGRQRQAPYDRKAAERFIDSIIACFGAPRLASAEAPSAASPIFVCGMFRSGSTLLETMLAAHPDVTAGGELDLLPRVVARHLRPFPAAMKDASPATLQEAARDYVNQVDELFPGARNVTDKRPDNVLYLGLAKRLFPGARLVCTRRHAADCALSVFAQPLGGTLAYATDLEDIAHWYLQHERLMAHWQAVLPGEVFVADYDQLVSDPGAVLRPLLEFLGLPWHAACVEFDRSRGLVQSASLWQVREALHRRSSGRWRNYAHLAPVLARLAQAR